MSLTIHENIHNKLEFFIKENKIPHIIFYGPSGSGKRTILNGFINDIYKNDKQKINQYVMHVNCAHSKGIRFIRDELKFFAKTNIHNKNNNLFKSIVLFNADKLTIDAQSALRRCIEQFSHTTRFFILVENENRLLKPILSRFCIIHTEDTLSASRIKTDLGHVIHNLTKNLKKEDISLQAEKLYKKGISIFDLMSYLEKCRDIEDSYRYTLLGYIDLIRQQIYNEKIVIFIFLYYFIMRPDIHLENLVFN